LRYIINTGIKIMTHLKYHSLFALALLLPFAAGCGGEQRLPGMPPLHPVFITVEQDGSPLADAVVSLLGDDEVTRQWPAGGVTDANGVAQMRTGGRFNGAAAGRFRVTVDKVERPVNPYEAHTESDSPHFQDYLRAQRYIDANTFIVVDPRFSSNDTPLTIEVVRGQRNYSVDISPAVRIRMTVTVY